MTDQSYLDKKYFIDNNVYNCPFCNRNNVEYRLSSDFEFDWSNSKKCFVYIVTCSSCHNKSMHLSYEKLHKRISSQFVSDYFLEKDVDIDSKIFYSVPTSFFVIDSRIPKILRELLSEAEGCVKMNYLTGASVCTRKAIYELTIKENAKGEDYESKIKFLKKKFSHVDSTYFDVLSHIKDMTSDKIHEQSWDKWDSKHLQLFIETIKSILYEIYVYPEEKKGRSKIINDLLGKVKDKASDKTKKS